MAQAQTLSPTEALLHLIERLHPTTACASCIDGCKCALTKFTHCGCSCPPPSIALHVESISCKGCESTIENALKGIEGIMGSITVDTQKKRVTIPGIPSIKEVVSALLQAGFEAFPLLDDVTPADATPEESGDLQFQIEGMTCHSCTQMVTHTLKEIEGVKRVISVNLTTKLATIEGNPNPTKCIQALEEFGYEVCVYNPFPLVFVELVVDGMTCHACTQTVANVLRHVDGVRGVVQVDLKSKIAKIPGSPKASECIATLENFGFTAKERENFPEPVVELEEEPSDENDILLVPPKPTKAPKTQAPTSHQPIMKGASAPSTVYNLEGASTCEVHIDGMSCASCVLLIETNLLKTPGVQKASVNLLASKAAVHYIPSQTSPDQLAELISGLGYPGRVMIKSEAGKILLEVEGISERDISTVTRLLDGIDGVEHSTVSKCQSHDHFVAIVTFDPATTKARDILKKSNTSGAFHFKYHPYENNLEALNRTQEIRKYKRLMIISLVFAIPTFIIAMVFMMIPALHMYFEHLIIPGLSVSNLLLWVLATPMQFWVGWSFYVNSWHSLAKLNPTMDVLIALGTSAAYFSSMIGIVYGIVNPQFKDIPQFFETAVFLIAFVMIGRYLENHAKSRTSQAISKLFGLQATEAVLLVPGPDGTFTEEIIDAHLIEAGDRLKVVPGEKIPCDGKVVFGKSRCNEAMITGEPMPVKKKQGDLVIGSTINQFGVLHIEATKVGSDTALSQIIKLVEDAQSSKGETQKLADTISGYFVPFVIAISLITFAIWDIVTGLEVVPHTWLVPGTNGVTFSLLFGITVLVIACPCALGLATPTAVLVGTGLAAQYHILIKGGDVLDKAYQLDNILFDKTGTLTWGEPRVNDCLISNEALPPSEFWSYIGSAEAGSEHPLGVCLFTHAKKQNAIIKPVTNFKAISGMGIRCTQDGKNVFLGNRSLMEKNNITVSNSMDKQMQGFENDGKTAMLLAVGDQLQGCVAVSDPLRPEAKWVVGKLHEMGIKVSVISGDNRKTVNAIAREINIDKVFAEVLPKDKKAKVEELQAEGYRVAMVGDGINDSPALAQANVGIAIGTGTDIAMESAGIVLMRSRLSDILTAVDLSKKTSNRIKMNFVWAFLYNTLVAAGVFYPLTLTPLPPWIAGLAMALSSISVLLSSLSLHLQIKYDERGITWWYEPPECPYLCEDIVVNEERDSEEEPLVHLDDNMTMQ